MEEMEAMVVLKVLEETVATVVRAATVLPYWVVHHHRKVVDLIIVLHLLLLHLRLLFVPFQQNHRLPLPLRLRRLCVKDIVHLFHLEF